MRGRAGSVPKILVFPTRISVSGLKIFAIWTLKPGYRDEFFRWILHRFWFACGIFHIISIQFNCSDTYSYKSCQSYERCESYNYVFCHVCFCFLNFMPQLVFDLFLISEFGLKFLIFSKVKLVPVSGSARSTGLMWRGPYFIVKNLWDIDLKINWFVKIPLHGHQRVAHSGLWAPDGSPSTQFATWNFGCGLVHSWTHRE